MRWKWLALLCLGAAALMAVLVVCWPQREQQYGLFRWDSAVTREEETQALEDCIRKTGVTELYQAFSKDDLASGQAGFFLRRMDRLDVTVYALLGEAEWAVDPDGGSLCKKLEEVAAYNASQKDANRVAGVMVDVEPYLLDAWEEEGAARDGLMENYLSGMRVAYSYAREQGLDFWVCIPTFYDTVCPDILEGLVSSACDGVAVMNYDRRDEYGRMEAEVALAENWGKEIRCIYELQEPGQHGLEEINTYAGEGLEALWQSAEELERAFDYSGLGFAYHYYEPLKELLGQE